MKKFDGKYMAMAGIWATNSRANRKKVGALLVKDNMIISDGYNGTPSGFENECETVECLCAGPCPRNESGAKLQCLSLCLGCPEAKLTTKPYVLHAEANAITKIAKSTNSALGSTLYVTCSPCMECAKLIIQAGIRRVVFGELYRDTSSLDLLKKANIEVEQLQ